MPDTLFDRAVEKAVAAFKPVESDFLRRGPIHGPDWPDAAVRPAILAALREIREPDAAMVESARQCMSDEFPVSGAIERGGFAKEWEAAIDCVIQQGEKG